MHSKSIFHGAILTVTMRWADRLIGLVSVMVLARMQPHLLRDRLEVV